MRRSFYISMAIAFLFICGLVFFLHTQNARFAIAPLMIGNVVLACISLLAFRMICKGLDSKNGHAFLRAKYSAMLLKFFLCVGLLVGYIFWEGKANIYKPAIFLLLGMYIVYAALEAIPLSKMAKMN